MKRRLPNSNNLANINMGSGFSQEATTQHTETHENNRINNNIETKLATTRQNSLPHDCLAILKDADSVIDKSSMDQLYAGIFLNKNRQKYWVDKASFGNCFMVFARNLSVTWGEDSRYWHWHHIKETSEVVVDVAEMLNVCWLEVHGKHEIAKLTPGIKYEIVFEVMLKDPVYGWEVPINIRLVLPDGNNQHHKQNLMEKPRSKWFQIPVGEFMVKPNAGGWVEFSMYEYEGGAWKKGLLVKGAAIRPK